MNLSPIGTKLPKKEAKELAAICKADGISIYALLRNYARAYITCRKSAKNMEKVVDMEDGKN